MEKSSNFISLQMGLRTLRYKPTDSALPSPAELLYGRNTDDLPRQGRSTSPEHRERLQRRQQQQREHHSAKIFRARPEPVLEPSDTVFVRNKEQGCGRPEESSRHIQRQRHTWSSQKRRQRWSSRKTPRLARSRHRSLSMRVDPCAATAKTCALANK